MLLEWCGDMVLNAEDQLTGRCANLLMEEVVSNDLRVPLVALPRVLHAKKSCAGDKP